MTYFNNRRHAVSVNEYKLFTNAETSLERQLLSA